MTTGSAGDGPCLDGEGENTGSFGLFGSGEGTVEGTLFGTSEVVFVVGAFAEASMSATDTPASDATVARIDCIATLSVSTNAAMFPLISASGAAVVIL